MDLNELIAEIRDFEKVKDSLFVKLISADAQGSFPDNVPYTPFLDMAAVYCLRPDGGDNSEAFIRITRQMINEWGKCAEQLHDAAVYASEKRFPADIRPLQDVLQTSFGFSCHGDAPAIYVVTNKSMMFGASVILYPGIPEKIRKAVGGKYYLLPSSVHEFLAVPAETGMDPAELKKMVQEINATVVAPEDRLSDGVYEYVEELNGNGPRIERVVNVTEGNSF